ncbi:helix-turn-helix domain-containing protein [Flagellimonas meridianipacifica]|uniref:helix-turn-helix domain-containing protein n=1 Tax=Flagellimonas meridianipacifica TaxID=1080225 RepID=UPI001304FEC5|nr:helix-turn-helix transcriptional regulator [Allomuricauda pacifica]
MAEYKEAIYKIIGERIKSQRESLNISQLKLSEKLDISRSSISNIEVGRHQIPLHVLYEISRVLELDTKEFLPTYGEIVSFATSEIADYSNFLKSSKLKEEQKEKLSDVLKNI